MGAGIRFPTFTQPLQGPPEMLTLHAMIQLPIQLGIKRGLQDADPLKAPGGMGGSTGSAGQLLKEA